VRATLAVALLLIGACATLPKNYPRPESTAFLDHESTAIGKEIAALAAQHPGESAFALIPHGRPSTSSTSSGSPIRPGASWPIASYAPPTAASGCAS